MHIYRDSYINIIASPASWWILFLCRSVYFLCTLFFLSLKKILLRAIPALISYFLTALDSFKLNPITPVSDQDRISPHYVYTISCIQVMRIKKNINYGITD